MILNVIIFTRLVFQVSCLEILSFSLPLFASEGEDVPFHCAYNVDSSKLAELDIKWYLGSSPSPFMVFLPYLQAEPQVIDPKFRQKIVYREGVESSGFIMVNISTELSGVYTCKVSTNMEERVSRKRITVYRPPSSIVLDMFTSQDKDKLSLSCSISGCLPPPDVSLSVAGSMIPHTSVYTSHTTTVTGSLALSSVLPSTVLLCTVHVPHTNYTSTVLQYYNSTARTQPVARPYSSAASAWSLQSIAVICLVLGIAHISCGF